MSLDELRHNPLALYYIFALLILVPLVRIYQRAGLKAFWVLLLAVPEIGAILAVLPLALQKWPKFPAKPTKQGAKK